MKRFSRVLLAALFTGLTLASCRPEARTLMLATTTSVDNSGLLAYLAPIVKRDTGIEIRWIAVGSGKAIRMALDGRVVAAITHDPDAEKALLPNHVKLYRQFMTNEFAIVGPPSNPARLVSADDAASAFRKISTSGSRFCSRADQSGTHSRELKIWKAAGVDPRAPNYYPLGQSMSALLRSANELGAYALTDRATFQQLVKSVSLREFVRGGSMLENVYAITLVKTDREDQEARDAAEFASWVLSPRGASAIASFEINGRQQFFPINLAVPKRVETVVH